MDESNVLKDIADGSVHTTIVDVIVPFIGSDFMQELQSIPNIEEQNIPTIVQIVFQLAVEE